MKTNYITFLLFGTALAFAGCKVKQFGTTYKGLINAHRLEIIGDRRQVVGAAGVNTSCVQTFEAKFPQCLKFKQAEKILENRLAFDNKCDGPIDGYHRFSFMEFSDPQQDTVFFVSFNQSPKGVNPRGGQKNLDTVLVRGSITFYTGNHVKGMKRDSVFHLSRRYQIYPDKKHFWSSGKELQLKDGENVDLSVYFHRNQSEGELHIYKIIDYSDNKVGGKKPVVFEFDQAIGLERLSLKKGAPLCGWGPSGTE